MWFIAVLLFILAIFLLKELLQHQIIDKLQQEGDKKTKMKPTVPKPLPPKDQLFAIKGLMTSGKEEEALEALDQLLSITPPLIVHPDPEEESTP